MQATRLYQEDWIGLRALDEAGKLAFGEAPGAHMQAGSGFRVPGSGFWVLGSGFWVRVEGASSLPPNPIFPPDCIIFLPPSASSSHHLFFFPVTPQSLIFSPISLAFAKFFIRNSSPTPPSP